MTTLDQSTATNRQPDGRRRRGAAAAGPGLFRANMVLVLLLGLGSIGWVIFAQRISKGLLNGSEDPVPHLTGFRLASKGNGQGLYDLALQERTQRNMLRAIGKDGEFRAYLYPPHLTPLFRPLSALSFLQLHLVLLVANALSFVMFFRWLGRRFSWPTHHRRLAMALAFSSIPVLFVFDLGQYAGIYLLACAYLGSGLERRNWWQGAAMMLVLSWKPPVFAVFALALLVAPKFWAVLLRLAVLLGVTGCFSLWWFGPEVLGSYVRILLASSDPDASFVSTDSMSTLRRLLEEWGVGAHAASSINTVAFVVGLGLVVWVWRCANATAVQRIAATLAISAATSKYQYPYDMAVLVLAGAALWDTVRARASSARWALAIVAAHIVFYSAAAPRGLLRDPGTLGNIVLAAMWIAEFRTIRRNGAGVSAEQTSMADKIVDASGAPHVAVV